MRTARVRRPPRRLLLLALPAWLAPLALVAWLAPLACGAGHPRRLVLIVVDTLRRDHLSVYGAKVATPNVEALARGGQVFQNALGSFHQTSMSMAAMFTGRTPSIESGDPTRTLPWNSSTWCGLARFAEGRADETCIPHGVSTLPERLQQAGWWTIGVVSNQFLYEPSGFGRGFDDWTEVDQRKPVAGAESREGVEDPAHSRYWRRVNEAALAAVDRAPRERSFLYVHYLDVHDYRMLGRSYTDMVQIVDGAVGLLLTGLSERGFLEDAVVVFTADHGERLGEDHGFPGELPNNFGHYGNPSWDEMLRVPLIVAPPFFSDTTRMVRTQDLFHMLLEIADLLPRERPEHAAPELFVGESNFRTYRQGRWKSTIRRSDGKAFLYDLETDPDELHDLSGEKPLLVLSHRNRVNELSERLRAEQAPAQGLSEDDEARLRSLGYLD